MSSTAAAVLIAGWLAWMAPFFLLKRGPSAQRIDRRARWGIALEAVGFAIVWFRPRWIAHPGPLRIVPAAAAFAAAAWLSWTSALALGRQWRFDAGLNADHQLVQTGAYRIVRHPIYTSMLCMLAGTGLLTTRLWLVAIAMAIWIAGTEIRVRIEDSLLASRFGEEFDDYRRRVHAYVPFLARRRQS
jgi:protein-S-isoprenylcysteine O-methyltransferase Ste14